MSKILSLPAALAGYAIASPLASHPPANVERQRTPAIAVQGLFLQESICINIDH